MPARWQWESTCASFWVGRTDRTLCANLHATAQHARACTPHTLHNNRQHAVKQHRSNHFLTLSSTFSTQMTTIKKTHTHIRDHNHTLSSHNCNLAPLNRHHDPSHPRQYMYDSVFACGVGKQMQVRLATLGAHTKDTFDITCVRS